MKQENDPREGQAIYVLAICISMCATECEAIVLANHHYFGISTAVSSLNLILWEWNLPFSVSRWWDLLLFVVFFYTLCKYENYRARKYTEWRFDTYKSSTITKFHVALFCGYIGGMIFGFIYTIPFFVLYYILSPFVWLTYRFWRRSLARTAM